ncbi:MAG: outer membrane lipoprotein LolB [Betaproteobacteria bacterium]|nr:outer membrane lipoprotein LolB [Betaproteobacteria bacterium]
MIRRSAAALLAILALTACAELQRLMPAEQLEFELAGRIAARYRDEAATGNIAWRHAAQDDEMLITSPVGSTIARLVRDQDGVVLAAADGVEHRAADAEALTERILGFRLPLNGLADWVRGRAAAGEPAVQRRDAAGRLQTLEQGGWTIEYQAWREDGLPVRLRLVYPGIELRLAIHEWKAVR